MSKKSGLSKQSAGIRSKRDEDEINQNNESPKNEENKKKERRNRKNRSASKNTGSDSGDNYASAGK